MAIVVIGAGGTGGLYGGVLARAGNDVRFLARGAHLQAIQQRGLEVRSADFGTFTVHANASSDPADLGQADLVLLAVKTYDLDSALEAASRVLAADGHVLTFQNGFEAPDMVARALGQERTLIGTTSLETTILEPGVIGHLTPGHVVTVGAFDGPPTGAAEATAQTLKQAGINVQLVPDGHLALWAKACLLVPLASVTSVCRASVGTVRDLPETFALVESVTAELVEVGRACGLDLTEAQQRTAHLLRTLPAPWTTSMMRDYERGKRTELEALTGALVRLGQGHGVDVPVTRVIYAILKLRQQVEATEPLLGVAPGGR